MRKSTSALRIAADLIEFLFATELSEGAEIWLHRWRREGGAFGQGPKRVLEVNCCVRVFGLVLGAIGIAPVQPEGIAL